MTSAMPEAAVAEASARLERTLFEVKRIIVGQDRMVERLLVCLLARGHCLIEGVPGLAKTLAAETLAATVARAVRAHPVHPRPHAVRPRRAPASTGRRASASTSSSGPIFANFVLADEINRAPAKVQSALLEVMAEHQVSIAGDHAPGARPVPRARHAEPDRVRGRVRAARGAARPVPPEGRRSATRRRWRSSRSSTGWASTRPPPQPALDTHELLELQRLDRRGLRRSRGHLVRGEPRLRDPRSPVEQGFDDLAPLIAFGASPRATLGLVAAGRALALIRGRTYVLPQDVYDVAPEVLRHRIVLSYEALADGIDADHIVDRIAHRDPAAADRARPGARPRRPRPRRRPRDRGAGRRRRGQQPVGVTHRHASARRLGRRAPCAASSSTCSAVSTACSRATTSGWSPRRAPRRGRAASTGAGDDVRRMDWPVTARTTVPHVRDTIADRELETWVVVDRSASLDFGTARVREARPRARRRRRGRLPHQPRREPRGAVRAHAEGTQRRPRARRPQRDVRAAQPHRRGAACRHRQGSAVDDLADALRRTARIARRRGLVVVVSDFLARDDWDAPAPCARRRATTCSRSRSSTRASSSSLRSGSSRWSTPRRGARSRCRPRASGSARGSPTAAAEQRAASPDASVASGAEHLVLRTDRDWLLDIVQYVETAASPPRRARRASGASRRGARHELPRRQPLVAPPARRRAARRVHPRATPAPPVRGALHQCRPARVGRAEAPGVAPAPCGGVLAARAHAPRPGVRPAGTRPSRCPRDGHRGARARRVELDEGRPTSSPTRLRAAQTRGRHLRRHAAASGSASAWYSSPGSVQVAVPPTHERHRVRTAVAQHRAQPAHRDRRGDLRVAVRDPSRSPSDGRVAPPATDRAAVRR